MTKALGEQGSPKPPVGTTAKELQGKDSPMSPPLTSTLEAGSRKPRPGILFWEEDTDTAGCLLPVVHLSQEANGEQERGATPGGEGGKGQGKWGSRNKDWNREEGQGGMIYVWMSDREIEASGHEWQNSAFDIPGARGILVKKLPPPQSEALSSTFGWSKDPTVEGLATQPEGMTAPESGYI